MARNLPPLNALKSFEAAARCGGYVLAAQELGVSPSAVSQQVRNLEAFFGKQLFMRYNNRIVLTDAARVIYPASAQALREIEALANRVRGDVERPRLVLSALPSLAESWLPARLSKVLAGQETIHIDFRIEEDPVDFVQNKIDLRLSYGSHLYSDLAVRELMHDEVLPLCSPALLAARPTIVDHPESLSDGDLIHTNWGPSFASYPTWREWFEGLGMNRTTDVSKGHRVQQSSFALSLAASGLGICLGQLGLARAAIEKGALIAPFEHSIPLRHAYCAVYPHAKSYNKDLIYLIEGLKQPHG